MTSPGLTTAKPYMVHSPVSLHTHSQDSLLVAYWSRWHTFSHPLSLHRKRFQCFKNNFSTPKSLATTSYPKSSDEHTKIIVYLKFLCILKENIKLSGINMSSWFWGRNVRPQWGSLRRMNEGRRSHHISLSHPGFSVHGGQTLRIHIIPSCQEQCHVRHY